MINIQEAICLAKIHIKKIEGESNIPLMLMMKETIEFEYGWMFFYQSKDFVLNGNEDSLVGGNAPFIVDKFNTSVHETGSRLSEDFYIEKYILFRDDINKFQEAIS